MPYYMPLIVKVGRTGATVLAAKDASGEKVVFGEGDDLESAKDALRKLAREYLAAFAEDGEDPISNLLWGAPKEEAIVFNERDLFPIVLRYLRKSRGLTQIEMASQLGFGQPAYSRLEGPGANPTVDTLDDIARVLGVSVHEAMYHRQLIAQQRSA